MVRWPQRKPTKRHGVNHRRARVILLGGAKAVHRRRNGEDSEHARLGLGFGEGGFGRAWTMVVTVSCLIFC